MDSVTEEKDHQHHEVIIAANLLIQYAKTSGINNLDGYKGPYLHTVYECIPYVDDAAYDDDSICFNLLGAGTMFKSLLRKKLYYFPHKQESS